MNNQNPLPQSLPIYNSMQEDANKDNKSTLEKPIFLSKRRQSKIPNFDNKSFPFKNFIELYFKQRECCKFVRNPQAMDGIEDACYCLRPANWHRKANLFVPIDTPTPTVSGLATPKPMTWNCRRDTRSVGCRAFGEMKLEGFNQMIVNHSPKYIRTDVLDNVDKTLDKLYIAAFEYFDLPKPQLIISVNGGAKKMIMPSVQERTAFKRGMMNVSTGIDTWITTGAFHHGVVKMVGAAARDYHISGAEKRNGGTLSVIGLGGWGAVYNRHQLIVPNLDHLPADSIPQVVYRNCKGLLKGRGHAPLDPYHDLFVLCDDGTVRRFGTEIEFRVEFEKYMAHRCDASCVQILMEGGKKTIKTAYEACLIGIPVVVMKGSKRAADVISSMLEETADDVQFYIDTQLDYFTEEWSIQEAERVELTNSLLEMYRTYRHLIFVFPMNDFTKELDKMILQAVFVARQDLSSAKKLKLAMTFNRADVAESEVFEKGLEIEPDMLDKFMINALCNNQTEFVQLFLEKGLFMEKVLTRQRLSKLYFGEASSSSMELISQWIKLEDEITPFENDEDEPALNQSHNIETARKQLSQIGQLIYRVTKGCIGMNIYEEKYLSDLKTTQVDEAMLNESLEHMMMDGSQTDYEKELMEVSVFVNEQRKPQLYPFRSTANMETMVKRFTDYPPRNSKGQRIYTEQDMFLWALLMNQFEISKLFWHEGKDHMGSALIAAGMCKNLSQLADKSGENDLANQYLETSQEYQDMAVKILAEAYSRDKDRTHLLLVRALPFWGRNTCMSIASDMSLLDFLCHTACQTRLNKIWMGGMPVTTNRLKILLNLPIGLFASKGLIFPTQKNKSKNEESTTYVSQQQQKMIMGTLANVSPELQPEEFNEAMPGIQETRELNAARAVAKKKFADPSDRKTFLENFRNLQKNSWKNVPYRKAVSLYYNAPIVKYTFAILMYLIFLGIYAYYTMVDLQPFTNTYSSEIVERRAIEITVIVIVFTMLLEEIRQLTMSGGTTSVKEKFKDYFSSGWNIFDIVIYSSFFLSVVLLFTVKETDFVYARTMFAINYSLFVIRFMQFYLVSQFIGPKINMIYRMLKDILFFLAIYSIVVLAYGSLAQSLRFPNAKFDWLLLKKLVYLPYWQTYGDLNLDQVEGDMSCTQANSGCTMHNAIVVVAFAVFMLFTNILLINLLIAMFGNTFNEVQEQSNKIWAFNRFGIIKDSTSRTLLPPPLNVFVLFFILCRYIRFTSLYKTNSRVHWLVPNEFIVHLEHNEDIQNSGFEQQCMEIEKIETMLDEKSASNLKMSKVYEDMEGVTKNFDSIINKMNGSRQNPVGDSSLPETLTSLPDEVQQMRTEIREIKSLVKKMLKNDRANSKKREKREITATAQSDANLIGARPPASLTEVD